MTGKRAAEMSLGLEVSKSFVAKVIQAGIGFVGTIIFARVLGPTGFGGFYLLLSVVELSKRPITGVSVAADKRFSEAYGPRREIMGFLVGFNLAMVALAAIVAYALRDQLVSYTGLEWAAPLFVVLFFALTAFPLFQNLLTAVGSLGLQVWIDTARSVLTFGLQLLFIVLEFGAAGMAIGLALGTFLLLPVTHYYLWVTPTFPTRETVRSLWVFARYSTPAKFVGKAYDRFDILLLGFLAVPAAAGHYEVAFKLTVPATFIGGLASVGLMAKVSDLSSQGKEVAGDITNTLAFSSLLAMPLFFGALAISETVVVTAYGGEYEAAAPLLVGLALYRVIQTQTDVLISTVNGLDRPQDEVRASTSALVLNIVLGVLLFYQYHALGVVIATVVSEVVRYLLLVRVVSNHTSATLLPRALVEQLLSGVLMYFVVDLFSAEVAVKSWVELTVLLGIGGAVYFAALTTISNHFRITVRSILSEVRGTITVG